MPVPLTGSVLNTKQNNSSSSSQKHSASTSTTSGVSSTSTSSLNSKATSYIRHPGLMNSNTSSSSSSSSTALRSKSALNNSNSSSSTPSTAPQPVSTGASATSFSKLRSNFTKQNSKENINVNSNEQDLGSSKKFTLKQKIGTSPKSASTLPVSSKTSKMLSLSSKSHSVAETFIGKSSQEEEEASSVARTILSLNKRSKTPSVSSSVSNLANSDEEGLNEKLNSEAASTISSLSSEAQIESDEKHGSDQDLNHQMPFKIRSSKYRHVYGNPHKEDVCFKNVKITRNAAHDSAFCAVNPKFVAIVTEECGGGAFVVIPIKQTGRIDVNTPKVTGHRGPVLDLKWNPFNDNEIASCSEDCTVKVWQIGDMGLYENLNEWVVDLHGHQRKVGQIEWHPTAENIMISSGADFQVILWNLEKAEPIRVISCHNDTIQSMNWNRDGSFFATTCKDKKLRLIDPRSGQVVAEGDGHQGSKISKVIVLGCGTKLFTCGFSRLSERQIALWNIKDLSKPTQMEVVDCSSGILIPYYDYDTKIVFVAGKGDGNIRYYEITDSEPYIHYLSEYKSSAPQRGLGSMPKRGLDVTKNEIFRFYKLHATGGICEPISMIVPRKSEVFQEDIYPDTVSGIPSLSCEEWLNGENREPILISMKDGAVPFMPKIVTYKQLGFSDLGNNYSRSNKSNSRIRGDQAQKCESTNKNQNSSWSSHNDSLNDSQPNTKLVLSSRSAFNKMSSSSSYSSSPTSSPNQNPKYMRLNSDNLQEPTKLNQNDSNSSDETKTTPTTSTTTNSANTNHASSNESINESQDEFGQGRKQSDDIEASYITNVSKNPITLRKTESLKLESVQSIRNRFDRVNSNNIGPLSRNKNLAQINSYLNSSIENLNENALIENHDSKTLSTSPPTLILSPLAGSNSNGKPSTPIPLLINTSANSSCNQTPSNNTNNNNSNSSILSNNSCIKKRVWTPVQSSSNLSSSKLNESNGTPNNFNDLQKSYFRLLEEKNGLKERNKRLEEELAVKDKRILALESKLNLFVLSDSHLVVNATDC